MDMKDVAAPPAVDAAETRAPEVQAITPLGVPWLRHDSFPTVKKVCAPDGLVQAKKATVVRVLQELKKGRSHIDQQLAQLETELLHVNDFLNGEASTLDLVHLYEQPSVTDGDAADGTASGASAGDAAGGESSATASAMPPVAALVEEDLASETPCTTVGLWRYLSHYSFFKTVTLEDMQEALLLEDPESVHSVGAGDTAVEDATPDVPLLSLPGAATVGVDDALRMRLIAALIPASDMKKVEHRDDDHAVEMELEPKCGDSFSASQTLRRLQDIGLVEDTRADVVAQRLRHGHDDEVSCEIRALQQELAFYMRRNNECKRTLRRSLERLKPWVTHDDDIQQIVAKFLKMWHRKKELRRKRKHKEKKQLRQDNHSKAPPPPMVRENGASASTH